LKRHKHSSPEEMCTTKWHIRCPIFVARQWLRHRTACIAGDCELSFNNATTGTNVSMKILDFYNEWQLCKEKMQRLSLRMCDEKNGIIGHTNVMDIWVTGTKKVFIVELECGKKIKTTKDHRYLTSVGWQTLEAATDLEMSEGDIISWKSDAPKFVVSNGSNKVVEYSALKSIIYAGEETTYDLEVFGPYHNFICNGFVVHNSINEFSARYSVIQDNFFRPKEEDIKRQSKTNNQGTSDQAPDSLTAQEFLDYLDESEKCHEKYMDLIGKDLSREQARIILPINIYTEFYWCINLRNLFHFLGLRMEKSAQKEIRDFADAMFDIVKEIFPVSAQAFLDYNFESVTLSKLEIEALKNKSKNLSTKNKRETLEWHEKMEKLGLDFSEEEAGAGGGCCSENPSL